MRTTIDLDEALLKRLRDDAHRQGVPFRTLLHRVIQRGLRAATNAAPTTYKLPSVSMGKVREGVDLAKSLQLSAALGDEQIIREISARK